MSEQKLERLTDAEIAKMLKDCMATSEPALYAVRLLLLEVSAHRRAERPGWREAAERVVRIKDWNHDEDGQARREYDNAAEALRAALHPSVAEGRGEDNSAPAKSGPV